MKIKVIKKGTGEVKVVEPKREPRTWSDITEVCYNSLPVTTDATIRLKPRIIRTNKLVF